jgi:hypothetical protein
MLGKGNDPNVSVFGALEPADQALGDEAIDSDTDRTWGQIYDWAILEVTVKKVDKRAAALMEES